MIGHPHAVRSMAIPADIEHFVLFETDDLRLCIERDLVENANRACALAWKETLTREEKTRSRVERVQARDPIFDPPGGRRAHPGQANGPRREENSGRTKQPITGIRKGPMGGPPGLSACEATLPRKRGWRVYA